MSKNFFYKQKSVKTHTRTTPKSKKTINIASYSRKQRYRNYSKIPKGKTQELFNQKSNRSKHIDLKSTSENILKTPNESWSTEKIIDFIGKYNAKAKIKNHYISYSLNRINNAKPYENLTQKQKNIILQEITSENTFIDDDGEAREYYTNLKYEFSKISPDELPMSSWENLEQTAKIFGKDHILSHFKNMRKLEKSITNKGYDPDSPITVEYIPNRKQIMVSMGNHRIQAVRNLIKKGVLNKNFKIPVLILIHDEKLRWKLRNKYQKLRKQKTK